MKGLPLSLLLLSWLATPGLTQEQGASVLAIIQFEGNSVFPDDELRDALQLVKKGDPYVQDKLEHDLHVNVGDRYRNSGYINVRFGTPRFEATEQTGAGDQSLYRVVVPVEEGSQFVYEKSIEVEGVAYFPDKQIRSIFPMASGDVVNFGALKAAIGELKALYGRRSFVAMDARPDHDSEPEGIDTCGSDRGHRGGSSTSSTNSTLS